MTKKTKSAKKPAITKDEAKTLRAARKILKRLSSKHEKLESIAFNVTTDKQADKAEAELYDFENEVLKHHIDFNGISEAFIVF